MVSLLGDDAATRTFTLSLRVYLSSTETNTRYTSIAKRKTNMFYAEHENYTRGIDIKSKFSEMNWLFCCFLEVRNNLLHAIANFKSTVVIFASKE